MLFSTENIDALNAVISVKVLQEDYKQKLDKAIKDYSRKVQMPGFRKGMVPPGMVQKMYGKSLLVEEVNKLLNESVQNYLIENKYDLLGHPMARPLSENFSWDNQNEFTFEFDIAFAPKFDLDLSDETFTKKVVKIDDSLIDSHIQNIAKRYGTTTTPETVEPNDLVYFDFVELDTSGTKKIDGIEKNAPIALDMVPNQDLRDKIVGQSIEFKINLNPILLLKSPDELSYLLGIKAEEANTISSNFELTITKISRLQDAELNEDFFSKVYGNAVKTETEFRIKVAEELTMMFNRDSERILLNDIQKRLLEKTNLQLPSAFLKRWFKSVNEKPITDEQLEQEWHMYENSTRWQLIENKLAHDNNITLTNEEVKTYVENLIQKQFQQFNIQEIDNDLLNSTVSRIMKNKDEMYRIEKEIHEAKLMNLFSSKCTIAVQEMTEDEFYKG